MSYPVPYRSTVPTAYARPAVSDGHVAFAWVAAVLTLCFATISAYFLVAADHALRGRLDTVAGITAKTLELQRTKMQWATNLRSEFPNLHLVAASVMTPGLCIAYRAGGGILSTVRATRAATEDELLQSALKRLDALIAEGVGTKTMYMMYHEELESLAKFIPELYRVSGKQSVSTV